MSAADWEKDGGCFVKQRYRYFVSNGGMPSADSDLYFTTRKRRQQQRMPQRKFPDIGFNRDISSEVEARDYGKDLVYLMKISVLCIPNSPGAALFGDLDLEQAVERTIRLADAVVGGGHWGPADAQLRKALASVTSLLATALSTASGFAYLDVLVSAEDALVAALVTNPDTQQREDARKRLDALPPFNNTVTKKKFAEFAKRIQDSYRAAKLEVDSANEQEDQKEDGHSINEQEDGYVLDNNERNYE